MISDHELVTHVRRLLEASMVLMTDLKERGITVSFGVATPPGKDCQLVNFTATQEVKPPPKTED